MDPWHESTETHLNREKFTCHISLLISYLLSIFVSFIYSSSLWYSICTDPQHGSEETQLKKESIFHFHISLIKNKIKWKLQAFNYSTTFISIHVLISTNMTYTWFKLTREWNASKRYPFYLLFPIFCFSLPFVAHYWSDLYIDYWRRVCCLTDSPGQANTELVIPEVRHPVSRLSCKSFIEQANHTETIYQPS